MEAQISIILAQGFLGYLELTGIQDWVRIETIDTQTSEFSDNICTAGKDEEIYVFYAEYGLETDPLKYIVRVVRTFSTR